jgi:hypothetical protein
VEHRLAGAVGSISISRGSVGDNAAAVTGGSVTRSASAQGNILSAWGRGSSIAAYGVSSRDNAQNMHRDLTVDPSGLPGAQFASGQQGGERSVDSVLISTRACEQQTLVRNDHARSSLLTSGAMQMARDKCLYPVCGKEYKSRHSLLRHKAQAGHRNPSKSWNVKTVVQGRVLRLGRMSRSGRVVGRTHAASGSRSEIHFARYHPGVTGLLIFKCRFPGCDYRIRSQHHDCSTSGRKMWEHLDERNHFQGTEPSPSASQHPAAGSAGRE